MPRVLPRPESPPIVFVLTCGFTPEQVRQTTEALLAGPGRYVNGELQYRDQTARLALPKWHDNDAPRNRDKPGFVPVDWYAQLRRNGLHFAEACWQREERKDLQLRLKKVNDFCKDYILAEIRMGRKVEENKRWLQKLGHSLDILKDL